MDHIHNQNLSFAVVNIFFKENDIMLKKFVKYVSQNMLGMVGMSVYILADTYFISVAVGANGITALNLVLPLYNLIFAIGSMIGVGSAIRYVVEKNKKNPDTEGYFFHALLWGSVDRVDLHGHRNFSTRQTDQPLRR